MVASSLHAKHPLRQVWTSRQSLSYLEILKSGPQQTVYHRNWLCVCYWNQGSYQTDPTWLQPHSIRRSRMVNRLISSKALDISIAKPCYIHLFLLTADNITRWHHTFSAHDLHYSLPWTSEGIASLLLFFFDLTWALEGGRNYEIILNSSVQNLEISLLKEYGKEASI